jgi:hypothetical protein
MAPAPDTTAKSSESALELIDDAALELIDDSRAPPLGADEEIRGGTGSAGGAGGLPGLGFPPVSPRCRRAAGADFRPRRAGARLVAACRAGGLLGGRGLADLLPWMTGMRAAEIARVVALALADYDRAAVEPLPPRLRALEAERLGELLATWLELEATRSPFRVLACEERHRLDIEGLPVTWWSIESMNSATAGWPSSTTRAAAPTAAEPGPTRASPSRNCRSTPRWPFPIAPWPPWRWHA